MKSTLEIELQPFRTPNFALAKNKPGKRQDGFTETPKYLLIDLDPQTLDRLSNKGAKTMVFDGHIVQLFSWRWCAQFYAWRARRKGFHTEIVRMPGDWTNHLLLGGKWGVRLSVYAPSNA